MRRKLILLAALAATALLALGTAMAWSATRSEGSSSTTSTDPWAAMHNGDMGAMHRGLDSGDLKRMTKACDKAMERSGARMDTDDMAEHMGGMMGPSVMGGTGG